MRTQPALIEALEDRRLLSVTVTSITATSAVAGTPANTAVRGEKVTLTAQVSASADDTVKSVTYFVDTNGDGTPDKGDKIIGKSSNAGKDFAVTSMIKPSFALGTVTVSAVASGKLGKTDVSAATTQDVTIVDDPPTIKKLTASPKKVAAGKKLTIVANNVKDKDGTVSGVEVFLDVNGNGQIDAGDTDLGAGTQVGKSGTWKFDASALVATAASGDSFTFLAQATDNDGSTSSATSPPSVTATVK